MDSQNTPPHQHTRTIHTTAYPTRHSPPSCGHAWGHTIRRVSLLLWFVRVFDEVVVVRVFYTATGRSDTPLPPPFRTCVRRTSVRYSDTSTARTPVLIEYATYRIAVCWWLGSYVCSWLLCVLSVLYCMHSTSFEQVFAVPVFGAGVCFRLFPCPHCGIRGYTCSNRYPYPLYPRLVHMFEGLTIHLICA